MLVVWDVLLLPFSPPLFCVLTDFLDLLATLINVALQLRIMLGALLQIIGKACALLDLLRSDATGVLNLLLSRQLSRVFILGLTMMLGHLGDAWCVCEQCRRKAKAALPHLLLRQEERDSLADQTDVNEQPKLGHIMRKTA